jgi:hypothetical protein
MGNKKEVLDKASDEALDGFEGFARSQLAELKEFLGDNSLTPLQLAEAMKDAAQANDTRTRATEQEVESKGIINDEATINESLLGNTQIDKEEDLSDRERRAIAGGINLVVVEEDGSRKAKIRCNEYVRRTYFNGHDPFNPPRIFPGYLPQHKGLDLISSLSQDPLLTAEFSKYLRPKDLINLFCISKEFNATISNHLLSSIRRWLRYHNPDSARIFPFKLYGRLCKPDPAGRTKAYSFDDSNICSDLNEVRLIPSLRWYCMVIQRERYIRDILAVMARSGHRMPADMPQTLKKFWLLMDVATTKGRISMLNNHTLWTNQDLYNAQMFIVKLNLMFNDPTYGPQSHSLAKLFLGQRGLYPLWQSLMRKRFTSALEIVQMKVRYDYLVSRNPQRLLDFGKPIYGIPAREVSVTHLEGWGVGNKHLCRPDELVPFQATIRRLDIDKHLRQMVIWGYFKWSTGENLVPTEEEMYISDEDEALANVDTSQHWKPMHARKKRWQSLTPDEQVAVQEVDDLVRIKTKDMFEVSKGALPWIREEPVPERWPCRPIESFPYFDHIDGTKQYVKTVDRRPGLEQEPPGTIEALHQKLDGFLGLDVQQRALARRAHTSSVQPTASQESGGDQEGSSRSLEWKSIFGVPR